MRGSRIKTRFLEEEKGFTLSEMLVTILIMIIVFFSLHSLFDMSMRVFAFGNNKVEAVENARLGMEKMSREIRAAYPVIPGGTYLFFIANGTTDGSTTSPSPAVLNSVYLDDDQLTIGNERGAGGAGDKKITCVSGAPCEYITYKLTRTADPNTICTALVTGPCTLRRVNATNSSGIGAPVVENVVPGGLIFTYLKDNGAGGTTPALDEEEIEIVQVQLRITVSKGTRYEATQNLTTEIKLRNRL